MVQKAKGRTICFVSPNAYPLLNKNCKKEFMGGAELQQVLLANLMKRNGLEVTFIVNKMNRKDGNDENIDGINIIKSFLPGGGLKYLRFLYPYGVKTWIAMKKSDADIYYQRGASSLTAVVALYCFLGKKIFIFASAHDSNFSLPSKDLPRIFEKVLFKWGLKKATCVITQSTQQKELLFKNYRRDDAIILRNIYPLRDAATKKEYILWVSRIRNIKRPLLFLELCEKLPEYKCVMIGGRVDSEAKLFDEVVEKSSRIKNLNFLGFKTLDETERYFDHARVFVNTSEMEGFPNTFLQAWSRGIPTVSFIDIDNIVRNNNLGAIVESIDEMVCKVAKLSDCTNCYSEKIRNYFERNHSIDAIEKNIIMAFDDAHV